MSAARAYEVGFVNVLASPGQALEEALDLARQLCANAAGLRAVVPDRRQRGHATDDALGWEQTDQALRAAATFS